MKVKLVFAICLLIGSATFAQKAKNWQLNSYQFNAGGVMSTKIPAASYVNYEEILQSQFEGFMVWDTPKSLTNLRMNPIYNANIQLFNSGSNAIQRFGFSLNSRKVSSFLTQLLTPVDTTVSPFGYTLTDLRVDHTSPVVTLDYAYLKQLKVTEQLHFQFGAGAYLGYSLGNKISTVFGMVDPSGETFGSGGYGTSDILSSSTIGNFAKHNFNAGIYASFGLEYSLHDKLAENQRWFLTYENRICYDFFAVKNVPSSWFSFQSGHMFGLKYYLNRK
ncbi:MAG: hypothetical protein RI948_588 [Bacteroidota bacterium]|jgi:hypothetical protein